MVAPARLVDLNQAEWLARLRMMAKLSVKKSVSVKKSELKLELRFYLALELANYQSVEQLELA